MSNPKQAVLALSSKEEVSDRQVKAILDILEALNPFLLCSPIEGQTRPELDGGVSNSAVATFVKATARLDLILDDTSRWSISEVNAFHGELIKTQKAQQALLIEQAASVKEVQRPAFQCRPAIYLHEDKFYAVWGDVTIEGGSIAGTGETPEKALLDFDAAFTRAPKDQIQFIVETVSEEAPTPALPLTVKPTRKKK